jgi:hypothetical protein
LGQQPILHRAAAGKVSSLASLTSLSVLTLRSSEDDSQLAGRTYWLWADSKQEVEAWVEALRYTQKYYKSKQVEEQHMKQHMELGINAYDSFVFLYFLDWSSFSRLMDSW